MLDFTVYNHQILFGLSCISGLGESSLTNVMNERDLNGSFTSLDNLLTRTSITESQLISLIKSGAIPCKSKKGIMLKYANTYLLKEKEFAPVSTLPTLATLKSLGIDTDKVKSKEDRLIEYNKYKRKTFYKTQKERSDKIIEDFSEKHLTNEEMWEFDTLAYFLTSNPFKDTEDMVTNYEEVENGRDVAIIGVISNLVKKKDKHKRTFAFVTLYTAFGLVELCCWSSTYSQYMDNLKKGVRIATLCSKDDDKYTIKEMKSYDKWKSDIQLK